MIIDLFDMTEFVKLNKLKEISNPMLLERGAIPSSDGLLSNEIFGVSIKTRRETYAYIDLSDYMLHPFVYKLLKRMDRRFEHIIYGSKKFIIEKGQLIEDEEKGETGLRFLYNNWEKINFEKNNSMMRNERIDLLNYYKKNVLFTKYWIVIPAYYRDINLQSIDKGKLSHNELNDKYSKLIRLCGIIKSSNDFDIVLNNTRAKIQEMLVDIYDYMKNKLAKKQGMLRKNLLGKSIDYGSRSVISASIFKANKYSDMNVSFIKSGIPLSQCCSLFAPFIIYWVRNYFVRQFQSTGSKYPFKNKDGTIDFVEIDEPELFFNDEYIKKNIDNFIFGYTDRFQPIYVPVKNKDKKIPIMFTGRLYSKGKPESESSIVNRPITWCDVLYQAAVDVTSDKMVYITRYPVLDYFGSFPSKIHVVSTYKTIPVYIGERLYENYPNIDLNREDTDTFTSFIDTISISNLYLLGLGGDYDGDQISAKGLYTQEANQEAKKRMLSKSNLLNIYGQNMRKTHFEGLQTLYMMTKFVK